MPKKKIIEVLFAAAVILLAANLLTAKYLKTSFIKKRDLKEITVSQINDLFWNDLNAFALQSAWIKKIKPDRAMRSDFYYSVSIPKDLPIPVVLKEIYESFYDKDVDLRTVEKVIGGKTELNIFRKGALELKAVFNYDKELKRNGEISGLIITGIGKLNKNDLYYLIKFPQTYAALLVPSKESVQISDTLTNYRKEYAVLLNDDISELDYRLRSDYSPHRIVSALRTVIGSFRKALFYVIDDRSSLYNSNAYYLIKEQLKRRGIKLFKLSKLSEVAGTNQAGIQADFSELVKTGNGNYSHFIIIPADDFKLLQPQIFSYIKIGYKFINPSRVLAAVKNKDTKKN